MHPLVRGWSPALLLTIAAVAGCGKETPVRSYTAPKDPAWRMVAAVVPADGQTWFFKVVGSSGRVAAASDEIRRFLAALSVEGSEVRWTLLPGWKSGASKGERAATLTFGGGEPSLEMSVSRFGGAAGGVLANVNRWRDQMGLPALADSELPAPVAVKGGTATIVDVESRIRPSMAPFAGGGGMGPATPVPATASEAPPRKSVRQLFSLQAPEGWVENPSPGGDRIIEYRAGAGAGAPLVTLTAIAGSAGGLAGNVNRWRGQAGLDPLDEDSAKREARVLPFLGFDGRYVELVGRDRTILVAFALDDNFSFFLKMDGTPDAVAKRKAEFETLAVTARLNRKHE